MLAQQTQRRRCVVLEDGTAISCHQRNVHETHMVVLEPSGHAYLYIRPDGTRTRHLTSAVLSNQRSMVLDTLSVRNRFTGGHLPYLCLCLMDTKDVTYQRRLNTLRARWPPHQGKVKVSTLYNNQEKRFEMQSIEGAAKVRLHASGKLVDLYYSIEVKPYNNDAKEVRSDYAHYATMHQSFAVTQIPESFNFPVNFLLAVKAAWDKDHDAEIEYKEETSSSPRVSPLPGNGAFAARPAFPILAPSTDSTCDTGGGNCLTLAEILRVAALPSKKLYHRVVVEMIGDGATLFVARRSSKLVPEIVVQLDQDQSVLTACDGFFTWYDDAGRLQHQFTRETIPPSFKFDTQRNSVSIASICQHIDYVLQAFKFAPGPSQLNKSPSSPLQDGLKLVEEVENKAGRFRAFCDGRIRVAFADRTILQVERDGDLCSFFFADGSANQTTLASAPLRHRAYIYQAMEFGDWAFSTQEQRMKHHVERQEAQAIVARELQRISVCCRMNTGPSVLQRCSKGKAASPVHDVHNMNEKTPSLALSLAEVQKLQAATQQHIVSVDHALHDAAVFIAANHHIKKRRHRQKMSKANGTN